MRYVLFSEVVLRYQRVNVRICKLNGYRGEKLIERLGLGIDGRAAERLVQQQARDAGQLGGVTYKEWRDFGAHTII